MSKTCEPTVLTDYYTYYPKKQTRIKKTNAIVKNTFVFALNEYYVLEKDGFFLVCILKRGELYLIWRISSKDLLPGEAISQFRKEYLSNSITQERLELFLENPVKYFEKYPKR